jgi:adenylate cyclase
MVSTNSLAGACASSGRIINVLDAQIDARRDKSMDQLISVRKGIKYQRRAICCVPILDPKGNVTGVVQVMNKRAKEGGTYRYFDPADETRLQGLVSSAAVSIKSAMLHDAADKSYWRLQRLLDVTKSVSQHHDIHNLLKCVLDSAIAVVDSEKGSIWTIDYERQELVSLFIVPGVEIRIPLDKGIAGSVASSGKFEHIKDAYKDKRFDQDIDRKTGFVTRNILCAPLISSHGGTLGVVQVLNKHGGRSFTHEDESLIQAFAAQAACSLENLQMFRHIHKLQTYANSVSPSADSIALTIDKHGKVLHSSINPSYVLGNSFEEMKRDAFPIWLVGSKKRNAKLAKSMARILGFDISAGSIHRPLAINLFNYSYVNPIGETILMNVTLSPTMNNAMSVKGLTMLMTCIKR